MSGAQVLWCRLRPRLWAPSCSPICQCQVVTIAPCLVNRCIVPPFNFRHFSLSLGWTCALEKQPRGDVNTWAGHPVVLYFVHNLGGSVVVVVGLWWGGGGGARWGGLWLPSFFFFVRCLSACSNYNLMQKNSHIFLFSPT